MILKGSRYEGLKITAIKDPEGRVRKWIHLRRPLEKFELIQEFDEYLAKEGDELDLIAFQRLRREILWWIIAERNEIGFAFDMQPGDELKLPFEREFGGY